MFESEEEREVEWLGAGAGGEGYIWKIGEGNMALCLAEVDAGGERAKMGQATRVREEKERGGALVVGEKERTGVAQLVAVGKTGRRILSYRQVVVKQKDPAW